MLYSFLFFYKTAIHVRYSILQGGQVMKYTAMLACGNYHGVVGFAKAKGPAIPIALQKVGAQTR